MTASQYHGGWIGERDSPAENSTAALDATLRFISPLSERVLSEGNSLFIARPEDQPTPAEGKPKYVTLIPRACALVKMADEKWESIAVVAKEMNLDLTLSSGQAFRWVWLEQEGVWAGSIRDK